MKRIGCLTPSGLIAMLLTLLVIGSASATRGGVLFNPGALNAQAGLLPLGGAVSHADTGGRCSACHTAIWESDRMADRCLDCHTGLYGDPKGFHTVMLAQGRETACTQCHTDHRGPQASLTIMDLARFPHSEVGFSLQAHQKMTDGSAFICSGCHGKEVSAFNPLTCGRCHADLDAAYMHMHQATFGADCLDCHDGLDTYGKAFDHNQAPFPLQGAHSVSDCAGCHLGARTIQDLRLASQRCSDCHALDDAHAGEFGEDCAACHTPEGWEGASFDHSRTAFPLTGVHSSLACESCHAGGVFDGTSAECESCHAEPIYHQNLFGGDCAACHTSDGWSPARYDDPHIFPINHGEGGTNACRTCHAESLAAYTCYSCHQHTPANIQAKHLEEVGPDFQDCTHCHAAGQKEGDEGEEGDHEGGED
jgi:hypothetical protein